MWQLLCTRSRQQLPFTRHRVCRLEVQVSVPAATLQLQEHKLISSAAQLQLACVAGRLCLHFCCKLSLSCTCVLLHATLLPTFAACVSCCCRDLAGTAAAWPAGSAGAAHTCAAAATTTRASGMATAAQAWAAAS